VLKDNDQDGWSCAQGCGGSGWQKQAMAYMDGKLVEIKPEKKRPSNLKGKRA